MNTDFEKRLGNVAFRTMPSEWRERILREARRAESGADARALQNLSAVRSHASDAERLGVRNASSAFSARFPRMAAVVLEVFPQSLREWFWPHPKAWGALAAAWGVILLLQVSAPDDSPVGGQIASASWQNLNYFQQEAAIMARLADKDESQPDPAPSKAVIKPRSSSRPRQSVG
jgi:hypothetical protein